MRPFHFWALLLTLCACGGDSTAPPTIEETTFGPELGVDLSASMKLENGEYIRDLEVGTGIDIGSNPTISILYTGWLADGSAFDSNQPDGGVYTFVYGKGKVIAGLDQGMGGMKRGGTRQLIIPPQLAYGEGGALPAVPPNSVVVFSVQLQPETTGSPVGCGCNSEGGAFTAALVALGALLLRRRTTSSTGAER